MTCRGLRGVKFGAVLGLNRTSIKLCCGFASWPIAGFDIEVEEVKDGKSKTLFNSCTLCFSEVYGNFKWHFVFLERPTNPQNALLAKFTTS